MVRLATRQSLPDRDQLDQQSGGRVPKLVLAVGLASDVWNKGAAEGLSPGILQGARPSWSAHRNLPIHVFFAQHASTWRSDGAQLCRYIMSGNPGSAALEGARMGDDLPGSAASSPRR